MKLDLAFITKYMPSRKIGNTRAFISPSREWLIGLAFALIVLFAGSICAGLFFLEVGEDLAATEEEALSASGILYEHNDVKAVLDLYKNRTARFEELSAQAPAPRVTLPESEAVGSGRSAPLAE